MGQEVPGPPPPPPLRDSFSLKFQNKLSPPGNQEIYHLKIPQPLISVGWWGRGQGGGGVIPWKTFILEGFLVILGFSYFYINNYFYHQIKGTAMGAIFAVVWSNLMLPCFEEKMFPILQQIYPKDFLRSFYL